jgi:asparagine synthase (glutamine-hydrolysing)
MSDFILDFRDTQQRCSKELAARLLCFFPDIRIDCFETDRFRLLLTSCDRPDLWAPYVCPDDQVMAAVCGRLAFDDSQWTSARRQPGDGGLASKAVYETFKQSGLDGVQALNGNFVVHIYDPANKRYYLRADRTGTSLIYGIAAGTLSELVFSSHPDAVAATLGVSERRDDVSLAEFLLTGKVSYPFTYYQDVRALEYSRIFEFDLGNAAVSLAPLPEWADLSLEVAEDMDEDALADGLANAFRTATEKRTTPRLGRSFVALSGGLDSRLVLSSAHPDSEVAAFCCFDEENVEYRTAREIAAVLGVELFPLKRSYDHYGDYAEKAVRISGGMGDIGSNHYLGCRDRLLSLGMDNLLTGCYCDYLFKSLALDTSVRRLSRREDLAPFSGESYLPHFRFSTHLNASVTDRLEKIFPHELRSDPSASARLEIAKKRIFPLQYEGDNIQRMTTQRTLRWSAPVVDNDIIDCFRKVPIAMRMNRSLFTKVVIKACNEAVCAIPDTNTAARIGAAWPAIMVGRYQIALRRAWERRRRSIASEESWPNWPYYLLNSRRVTSLWNQPDEQADAFFRQVMGGDFRPRLADYMEMHGSVRGSALCLRLLTLKIWFQLRAGD